jgi:hypothetical protein
LLPSRARIAVVPATDYQIHKPLFDMLSAALCVDFEPHASASENYHGLIVLSEDEGLIREANERNINCYQVHSANPHTVVEPPTVRFASSTAIHRSFRSAQVVDASLKTFGALPQSLEPLAEVDGQPVWGVAPTNGRQCHHVGVPLPWFAETDFFQAHFRASRWFAMVPLLHFLRHLLGPDGWKVAEPRATFIIDDPNFHHRSYGYIDFAELMKHAETHNYHATVATVPFDTWYFNRKVAALFRAHRQQVSVMMHGVNHLADELAREYTEDGALALLAVGLRRIAAFEAQSGVKVDRIMAAPHGAFKESMAEPMLRLGFEAGCVSIGSLTRWNTGKNWPPDLGIPMAQALGRQAFPVFHRTSTNETDIRLSAFLGHPVVIATHHLDYVSNFARIESLAKMVNEISSPRWMSAQDISRTNYVSSVESDVLCITPYARRLKIAFGQGIRAIQLTPSPFCPEARINLREQPTENAPLVGGDRLEYSASNNVIELHVPPRDPVAYQSVAPYPLGPWAVTRRLLAEGRDRVIPMLSFASAPR